MESMAIEKYVVLVLLLGLLALGARGDAGFEPQEPQIQISPGSDLVKELEDLKSKASSLESMIEEKKSALREKELLIAEREKLLEEKSKDISLLQNEIDTIQKKGAGDLEAEVTKAYARVSDLEEQVKKLEEVLREQKQRQHSLELQASKAENQAKDFSAKNKKLQDVVTEQKARIQKVEQALQFAEATMLKSQAEAKVKAEALMEVHGAWLPHWLAVRLVKFQTYAEEHWAKHAKPAINVVLEKASEKATIAHNWARPHLETAKTQWSPALKKQWQQAMVSLAPHVETLKTKSIEGYEVCRDAIKPHLVKAQESLSPHVQTVKDLCGPYIDQVVAASRPHIEKVVAASQPHIEKATVILQPYTKPVANAYGRFLTTATKYHRQFQRSVRQTLKKYDLTSPLATKELVWFMVIILAYILGSPLLLSPCLVFPGDLQGLGSKYLSRASKRLSWAIGIICLLGSSFLGVYLHTLPHLASALLALPVFGILMAYSSIFGGGKKARKPSRNIHTGNAHRKHKRSRHMDK